jgi:hypothetical protein
MLAHAHLEGPINSNSISNQRTDYVSKRPIQHNEVNEIILTNHVTILY